MMPTWICVYKDNFQKNLSKCISPQLMTFILSNADRAHSSVQDTTLETINQALILTYFVALAEPFTEAQVCGYYRPSRQAKEGMTL